MSSNLQKKLRYLVCFLVGVVATWFLSLGWLTPHPTIAAPSVAQPESARTAPAAMPEKVLSTWRNPTHQELNFYQ
jgi:hypothetical protein